MQPNHTPKKLTDRRKWFRQDFWKKIRTPSKVLSTEEKLQCCQQKSTPEIQNTAQDWEPGKNILTYLGGEETWGEPPKLQPREEKLGWGKSLPQAFQWHPQVFVPHWRTTQTCFQKTSDFKIIHCLLQSRNSSLEQLPAWCQTPGIGADLVLILQTRQEGSSS